MSDSKRTLVLVVDVDNDLGKKVKVKGPIVGRGQCLDAAVKLAIADPTETDANAVFQAIKTYDELKKKCVAEIAVITGDNRLGHFADKEVVKQLEKIIYSFSPESCIFVSDGASDDQVLPIIQSRVKIDGVKRVVMKQTQDIEKTYFVLLEKLREPSFARIVFGVPGLALLLYFFLGWFGVKLFVGLFGAYLILRGFGLEEHLFKSFSEIEFSVDKVTFIFYFAAIPFFLFGIWLGASRVYYLSLGGVTDLAKIVAWFIKDMLLLLPMGFILVVLGKSFQTFHEKKNFLLPSHAVYLATVVLLWLIFSNASDWVLGNIGFAELFYSLLLSIVIMLLLIYLAREFKNDLITKLRLEGKEVYTEIGSFLGKIVGVDKRKETFIIQTKSGQKFDLGFDHISNIGEKVIIRY